MTPAQTVSEGRSHEDTCAGTHTPAVWLGEQPARGASQPWLGCDSKASGSVRDGCLTSLVSGGCPPQQAGASQVQSPVQRALQTPRAKPWLCQTTSLNPQVFRAGSFCGRTAESWPARAGTAAWACTSEDLMEPSQNFICWQKERKAAQMAAQPQCPAASTHRGSL